MSFLTPEEQKVASQLIKQHTLPKPNYEVIDVSEHFPRFGSMQILLGGYSYSVVVLQAFNRFGEFEASEHYLIGIRNGISTQLDAENKVIYRCLYKAGCMVEETVNKLPSLARASTSESATCNCPITDLWNGVGHSCGRKE